MSVTKLLDKISEAGLKISLKEDNLFLVSASGDISRDLQDDVRKYKARIFEYLKKIENSKRTDSLISEILPQNTLKENLCYRQQNWWRAVRVGRGFSPVAVEFIMEGQYNKDLLISSFEFLANRHQILKATFSINSDSLLQEVSEKQLLPEFFELGHLSKQEAEQEILKIKNRMKQYPHISKEQSLGKTDEILSSAGCANLGENKIFICVYVDHIISDGYSMKIIRDDFREIYRAKTAFCEPDLPSLRFQYLDYVAWSNRLSKQGSAYSRKLNTYWKRYCESLTVTRLSHEYQYADKEKEIYQSENIRFGAPSNEFLSVCKAEKYPVFSALLTIFFVAVSRLMNQPNPTIATILSGRDKFGTENLVGSFAEMVYLKLDIPETISYRDLVAQCDNTLNEIHENLFVDWSVYLPPQISASYIARDEEVSSVRKTSDPSTGFAFSIEPGLSLSPETIALYTEECTYYRSATSYTSTNFIWFRIFGYEDKILCHIQYETRHFTRDKMHELISLFKRILADFYEKQIWL